MYLARLKKECMRHKFASPSYHLFVSSEGKKKSGNCPMPRPMPRARGKGEKALPTKTGKLCKELYISLDERGKPRKLQKKEVRQFEIGRRTGHGMASETVVNKCIDRGLGRWSDIKSYFTKLLAVSRVNHKPTKEDHKAKLDILGIENEKTCFLTKLSTGSGIGDHFFETNNYCSIANRGTTLENYLYGPHGVDDWWNLIPVKGQTNKNYKIFALHNSAYKKDVGYQDLNLEEINGLDAEKSSLKSNHNPISDKERWCRIHAWKEYIAGEDLPCILKYLNENGYYDGIIPICTPIPKQQQQPRAKINFTFTPKEIELMREKHRLFTAMWGTSEEYFNYFSNPLKMHKIHSV